jgi:hypothetical protein
MARGTQPVFLPSGLSTVHAMPVKEFRVVFEMTIFD